MGAVRMSVSLGISPQSITRSLLTLPHPPPDRTGLLWNHMIFVLFCSETRVSLYIPGHPGGCFVDKTSLELTEICPPLSLEC